MGLADYCRDAVDYLRTVYSITPKTGSLFWKNATSLETALKEENGELSECMSRFVAGWFSSGLFVSEINKGRFHDWTGHLFAGAIQGALADNFSNFFLLTAGNASGYVNHARFCKCDIMKPSAESIREARRELVGLFDMIIDSEEMQVIDSFLPDFNQVSKIYGYLIFSQYKDKKLLPFAGMTGTQAHNFLWALPYEDLRKN